MAIRSDMVSFPLPGWLWRTQFTAGRTGTAPPAAGEAGAIAPARRGHAHSASSDVRVTQKNPAPAARPGRRPGLASRSGSRSQVDGLGLHLQLSAYPAHGQARPGLGGVGGEYGAVETPMNGVPAELLDHPGLGQAVG